MGDAMIRAFLILFTLFAAQISYAQTPQLQPLTVAPLDPQTAGMSWICAGISSAKLSNPGSGYTPGIYPNTPLLGGNGKSATAKLTVAENGSVTDVTFIRHGQSYKTGDVLSASLPDGTGFSLTVTAIVDFHPALVALKDSPKQLKAQLSANPNDCH